VLVEVRHLVGGILVGVWWRRGRWRCRGLIRAACGHAGNRSAMSSPPAAAANPVSLRQSLGDSQPS